jgi:hypothetical protein
MDRFSPYFEPSEEELEEERKAREDAHEVLAWARHPYFKKHIASLERMANEPLPIGDNDNLVQAAVRANVLREVRADLLKLVDRAKAAISVEEG